MCSTPQTEAEKSVWEFTVASSIEEGTDTIYLLRRSMIHFSFSRKAFFWMRLSRSFAASTLSSDGFWKYWRLRITRMVPSSFNLLINLRMALSRSSLTTSTMICLACCCCLPESHRAFFFGESSNPNPWPHNPLPRALCVEYAAVTEPATALCGKMNCCKTFGDNASETPRVSNPRFETEALELREWRELAMAVGPVTNTDLICPQARETNRFPAAVFMLALQCVLLLTAFRSILDSDST